MYSLFYREESVWPMLLSVAPDGESWYFSSFSFFFFLLFFKGADMLKNRYSTRNFFFSPAISKVTKYQWRNICKALPIFWSTTLNPISSFFRLSTWTSFPDFADRRTKLSMKCIASSVLRGRRGTRLDNWHVFTKYSYVASLQLRVNYQDVVDVHNNFCIYV